MRWHLVSVIPLAIVAVCVQSGMRSDSRTMAQQIGPVAPAVKESQADHPHSGKPSPSLGARSAPSEAVPPAGDMLAADPFRYRVPEGSEGFVPSADVELPEGIRVLGILMMGSGHAIAALQLPGGDEVLYVRENDDVQIRAAVRTAPAGRSAAGSPSPKPSSPTGSGLFYLKISRITPQHVEVYPQHNPSNIQILR
jgi:hypothetical protein